MNIFAKQKLTHRLRKQAYGYQGESGWERNSLGDQGAHAHTAIYKIDEPQIPIAQHRECC